ncbi:MAG: SDR family oxidoreductase [Polaromonas sp.]|nr:SDR family oxidoreductase [Polaromonas sp.]
MTTQEKMPGVAGKKVLLTGASRGLGFEMCKRLLHSGATVIAVSRSAVQPGSAFASLHTEFGPTGQLQVEGIDVADIDATRSAISRVLDRHHTIDVLVNNAGLGMDHVRRDYQSNPVRFWDVPHDKWNEVMRVNAVAPQVLASLLVPNMIAQGWGRIINVGTTYRTMQRFGFSPYGPSKTALETATVVWAMELAGTGVTANVILPGGAAATDMAGDPAHFSRTGTPLLPADIMADPLCWLISTDANEVTGKRVVCRNWTVGGPISASVAASVFNAGFVTPTI